MHSDHQDADYDCSPDHSLVKGLSILESHASYCSLRKSEDTDTYEHPERDQISRSESCYVCSVLALSDEVPSWIICSIEVDDLLHAAACSYYEEQKQECSACHDESLDSISDYNSLESAESSVDDNYSREQHQSAYIRETCDSLQECSSALELSYHLCDEEHYEHYAADDVHCR